MVKTKPEVVEEVADFAERYHNNSKEGQDNSEVVKPPHALITHELDIELPAAKALGHTMFIAGTKPAVSYATELGPPPAVASPGAPHLGPPGPEAPHLEGAQGRGICCPRPT